MKQIKVSNLYGLPFVNDRVAEALKAKGVNVVLSVERLFESKLKGKTVVIDQFGKLVSCGIPILGYQRSPTGVRHKVANEMKPNEVTISYPKFIGAVQPFRKENAPELDMQLLSEFQAAKDEKGYKKLAKKYAKEIGKPKTRVFKWFRRAVMDQFSKEASADAPVNNSTEE